MSQTMTAIYREMSGNTTSSHPLHRPGIIRPLADDRELRDDEIRVDNLQVEFTGCWVSYRDISDWDRISRLIAPPRSDDEYAFTRSGHHIRRKRSGRSDWPHCFWDAQIRHYPTQRGGPLYIRLTINPTRFEAFRALAVINRDGAIETSPIPERARRIRALTYDANTNFIPTSARRRTYQSRSDMFRLAVEEFKQDLAANLQRAGVPIAQAGPSESVGGRPWLSAENQLLLNWHHWRVDRLEQYIEVSTDDPLRVVRLGYLDARARFNTITSSIYPLRRLDRPHLASELDRNKRALSYSVRLSSKNNVTVYAKAAETIRIERRWVRGDGSPEVGFTPYQRRGFEGLIDWVDAMNPGSTQAIAPVEQRLYQLSSASPSGSELWFQASFLAVRALSDINEYQDFVARAAEYGGFQRSAENSRVQRLLDALIALEIFETLGPRENIVPVPALQSYLLTHREVRELEECRRPSSS